MCTVLIRVSWAQMTLILFLLLYLHTKDYLLMSAALSTTWLRLGTHWIRCTVFRQDQALFLMVFCHKAEFDALWCHSIYNNASNTKGDQMCCQNKGLRIRCAPFIRVKLLSICLSPSPRIIWTFLGKKIYFEINHRLWFITTLLSFKSYPKSSIWIF